MSGGLRALAQIRERPAPTRSILLLHQQKIKKQRTFVYPTCLSDVWVTVDLGGIDRGEIQWILFLAFFKHSLEPRRKENHHLEYLRACKKKVCSHILIKKLWTRGA